MSFDQEVPSDRKKPLRFPETRWSLVGRAAASDELTRQQALGELLVAYLPGLRAFLISARRVPTDLVDDLLQDFVADRFLAKKLVHHADQGKGKFRNFLLKSLSNFATTRLKREYAARAMAADMDGSVLALASCECDDRFDQEWLQQVVRDALELMEADCRDRGRSDLWEVFRLRVVDPMLHDAVPADYQQIVGRFHVETPRQAINLLANAKRCFVKHLRAAVGRYVHDDALVDEEIADLREILG
ncbi:MAG: sigma-70 family RNA polymerase sigma factor [Planctomycetes bacterium]|nr:sigma-70 family RNA polymerase sigma factor [Planctomycetota bacterium]